MRQATWIFCTMFLLSGFTLGCGGDEKGLDGSQCELVDCSFDTLICQLYAPPNEALRIDYKRTLEDGGWEYAAVIIIDLDGVEQISGWEFEGQEFNNRVMIYRIVDKAWGDFDGNGCEFKSGNKAGDTLEGKCSFAFDNGRFATANFKCTLEATEDL